MGKRAAKISSSLWNVVSTYTGGAKIMEIDVEKEKVIPSFQKLVTRNNVLEGYVAQYELLKAHQVTPSEFEKEVALLAPEAAVDGYIILQPAQNQPD